MKLELISASRLAEGSFWARSALGQSLQKMGHDARLTTNFAFENKCGLPDIYNEGIQSARDSDVLIFMHDDVWLQDFFFVDRVIDGLERYDVIGLAGCTQRRHGQANWAFEAGGGKELDFEGLSGVVGHGAVPLGLPTWFGPVPAECELLDGVFLAAKKETLLRHQVMFDPQFTFHFYDMDFCRTARKKQLRLGTWGISVTHVSGGDFGGQSWADTCQLYFNKWGD
jgi:GT2 family glycosyltransferase